MIKLKYFCCLAVLHLSHALLSANMSLRDIVHVRSYRPIKCSNITSMPRAYYKNNNNNSKNASHIVDKLRSFRYINIADEKSAYKLSRNDVNNHRFWRCIRCPAIRVFSPGRKHDGVRIFLPMLTNCAGHRIPPDRYGIETFFSPATQISLSEGSHHFIGRIKNMQTQEIEKVCHMRFKVKVRRCQKFTNSDTNLRIFCDSGNVWGTKCKFACKNNSVLSSNQPIYCNDNLTWSGKLPYCKTAKPVIENAKPFNPIQDCTLPRPQPSSEFICDTPANSWAMRRDDLLVPEGTICKLHCQRINGTNLLYSENNICWNGKFNGSFTC